MERDWYSLSKLFYSKGNYFWSWVTLSTPKEHLEIDEVMGTLIKWLLQGDSCLSRKCQPMWSYVIHKIVVKVSMAHFPTRQDGLPHLLNLKRFGTHKEAIASNPQTASFGRLLMDTVQNISPSTMLTCHRCNIRVQIGGRSGVLLHTHLERMNKNTASYFKTVQAHEKLAKELDQFYKMQQR